MTGSVRSWVFIIAAWGSVLHSHDAHAMDLAQMQTLPGTRLLGLRVDALWQHCGLPSAIVDATDAAHNRHTLHWRGTTMRLSAGDWDLTYAPRHHAAFKQAAWTNPAPANRACRSGLAALELHAQGHSGILSVKKRADHQGYVTTYRVPDELYAAHKVVGLSGRWKIRMPLSRLRERYGNPDEVVQHAGVAFHRYWVIAKNNKQMPISLHAVDFEIGTDGQTCARYTVHTSEVGFVQQKLDALMRQWEKDYVLD